MSKQRVRIYTEEDVLEHNTSSSCWISRNGRVYDVTSFLADHPGGDDLILKYAGKDVGAVMKDPEEHVHSDSAYEMLEDFVIGRLGVGEAIVSDDWVADDDFHPEETDLNKDFEKNEFLDLRKPMLKQVWEANWSKSYYLQQVHQPRHLHDSARFFESDFLEMFTRTVWYVVPMIWFPIAAYLYVRGLMQFAFGSNSVPPFWDNPLAPLHMVLVRHVPVESIVKATLCFFLGNVVWTILEYTLHRFLFHLDYYLPDHPAAFTLHFLLHGVHHYLPMDRLRLVMPPTLFTMLSFPFTQLAHAIFPAAMANSVIAGSFTFYVLYDCMHYALHHTRLPAYMREMKKYHLAHHYKNFELGFGVTSKIWDYVFNTVLPI
ncbi:oxidoreductase [Panus rudis PR-1116 ss-1]|nr:oxidoreductase [Panus rudis PR-1116 ss-1]